MDGFLILFHDVAPPHLPVIRALVDAVRACAGPGAPLAAAVVPCWHGQPLTAAPGFAAEVRALFDERLLHGHTHHTRRGGALGALTGQANEFTGLSAAAAAEKLRLGQALFAEAFGAPAVGFVPPAWQCGPLTPALLAQHGLRYCVGLWGLGRAHGASLPLATWSWDAGVIAALGWAGEALGTARAWAWPQAMPCVVVHPADAARGYLPRILRRIEGLLAGGRRPVTVARTAAHLAGGG